MLALLALFLALAPASVDAGAPAIAPEANAKFRDPELDVRKWVKAFESGGREIYDHRKKILNLTGLQKGGAVADIGAGTGLFTMLFAEHVGKTGSVYAVDISARFLDHIAARAKKLGRPQIKPVLGSDRSVELAPASIDLAFICDTYHHFEYPAETLASLHRALRPGGEVVLVEFRREEGKSNAWTLGHVRAGEDVFTKEFAAAGFEVAARHDFLKDNYILRLRKKP